MFLCEADNRSLSAHLLTALWFIFYTWEHVPLWRDVCFPQEHLKRTAFFVMVNGKTMEEEIFWHCRTVDEVWAAVPANHHTMAVLGFSCWEHSIISGCFPVNSMSCSDTRIMHLNVSDFCSPCDFLLSGQNRSQRAQCRNSLLKAEHGGQLSLSTVPLVHVIWNERIQVWLSIRIF